jgi:hypothetical protein
LLFRRIASKRLRSWTLFRNLLADVEENAVESQDTLAEIYTVNSTQANPIPSTYLIISPLNACHSISTD